MATPGNFSQVLSHVAREIGNDMWLQQIVDESALLDKKVMPVVRSEGVHVLNLLGGLNSSARALADGASIAAENKSAVEPVQLRIRPQSFMAITQFGREAARVIRGPNAASFIEEQMEIAGRSLSQTVGRAIINHIVGVITATASAFTADFGNSVTLTLNDVTGVRAGAKYDLFERSNASAPAFVSTTPIGVVLINDVTDNGTGIGGTVSASCSTAVTCIDGYTLCIRGLDANNVDPLPGSAQAKRFVNLRLAAETDSNVLLYEASASASGSTTVNGYKGNKAALANTGELVESTLASFASRIETFGNSKMSHIIMHPLAYQEYESDLVSNRRFLDNKYDQRVNTQEVVPYFRGMPVILDRNCPADQIYVYGKNACDLLQFQDIGADEEAGDSLLLSRDAYTWEMQVVGMFNTKVKNRRTLGVLRKVFLGADDSNAY